MRSKLKVHKNLKCYKRRSWITEKIHVSFFSWPSTLISFSFLAPWVEIMHRISFDRPNQGPIWSFLKIFLFIQHLFTKDASIFSGLYSDRKFQIENRYSSKYVLQDVLGYLIYAQFTRSFIYRVIHQSSQFFEL